MDLEVLKQSKALIDIEWPNHKEILGVWLPKSKVMIYHARNDAQLNTLLTRLPQEWSGVEIIPFRQWFHSTDAEKAKHVGKNIVLTRYITETEITTSPGYLYFLPFSFIAEVSGRFIDARDSTGYKWGDYERKITSCQVLNDEIKL